MTNQKPSTDAGGEESLSIDIPVVLTQAKVVYNIDHLLLWGDASFGIVHMGLVIDHFREHHSDGHLIAIFHSDAGHVALNDRAYNAARVVTTGNPYKSMLSALMAQGADVELCGATAAANRWGNADLLPGIRVNTNAMVRLIQLAQVGYVPIKQ